MLKIISLLLIIFSINLINAQVTEINHNSKFSQTPTKVFKSENFISFKTTNNKNNKVFYGIKPEKDKLEKRYGINYADISEKYFNDRSNGSR